MHDCHLIVSIGAGLYFFLQSCSNPDKIFQIGTGLRLDFKHWGFPWKNALFTVHGIGERDCYSIASPIGYSISFSFIFKL